MSSNKMQISYKIVGKTSIWELQGARNPMALLNLALLSPHLNIHKLCSGQICSVLAQKRLDLVHGSEILLAQFQTHQTVLILRPDQILHPDKSKKVEF
jgi:hypothetical protein